MVTAIFKKLIYTVILLILPRISLRKMVEKLHFLCVSTNHFNVNEYLCANVQRAIRYLITQPQLKLLETAIHEE